MELIHKQAYTAFGLDQGAQERLASLGDLVQSAGLNVTGIESSDEIEKIHFLDSLSLLRLPEVRSAQTIVDIGSGGGFPALVLAIAQPDCTITAIDSVRKKCEYIEQAAASLCLANLVVCCERAEDHGRSACRAKYDVAVSRALAALPVVAEYSLPLVRLRGTMVAMKGLVSDQECTHALAALGILGADGLEAVRLDPFPGSRDRLAYVARKTRATPDGYPRRAGIPQKRPLGRSNAERTGEARS